MTDDDYTRKLDELDRLINDWDVPMQPDRVWRLLDDALPTWREPAAWLREYGHELRAYAVPT